MVAPVTAPGVATDLAGATSARMAAVAAMGAAATEVAVAVTEVVVTAAGAMAEVAAMAVVDMVAAEALGTSAPNLRTSEESLTDRECIRLEHIVVSVSEAISVSARSLLGGVSSPRWKCHGRLVDTTSPLPAL